MESFIQPRTPRPEIDGLADGRAIVFRSLSDGLTPPPVVTVTQWAAEKRMVAAESGSPFPGKWLNERVPYLTEIMDCLSLSHPCRSVTFKKSAQVAGTEAGINLFGCIVDHEPAPMLIVLPSIEEAQKYVKLKLQPTIDETPSLKAKVKEQKSRDEDGSTTALKKFRGGFAQVTGANSSKGLQMISVRVVIMEEVSEWPWDAGGRGDPVDQAMARTKFWTDRRKVFFNSTPGIAGMCRISEKYEASDQRRCYVPCPHCGTFHVLEWKNLRWKSEREPHGAYFVCPANGCVIEQHHKRSMVARHRWIKTYDDEDPANPAPQDCIEPADIDRWRRRPSAGREPGFHIWQAYSPAVSWDDTVHEYLDAQGDPENEKTFTQQGLGEAWEEKGEAPDVDALLLRRTVGLRMGKIPPGGLVLTGMADIQGNRIEWAVYAWGIGLSGWIVDKGIIEGDPSKDDAVWAALGAVTDRQYEDWQGRTWPIEAFGVDSGYLSHAVYAFTRGRPRAFALDGRADRLMPYIGTPKRVDVNWRGKIVKGGAMLWPTGTHQLKSWVYGALRKTIEGADADGNFRPGTLHFGEDCDKEFFEQMTAEYLADVELRGGRVVREWRKKKNRPNEQLDIIVGARAMAEHLGLGRLTADGWARIAAERGAPPEQVEMDLMTWARGLDPRTAAPGRAAGTDANGVRVPQAAKAAPNLPASGRPSRAVARNSLSRRF